VADDVQTTPSGLQIIIEEQGGGKRAKAGDRVAVHYSGMFDTGMIFDSSEGGQPIEFVLGKGQVIAGWDEGIALLNEGGKAKLIIPPDLAYGVRGAPPVIPPNSTLTFDVELVTVK
jgi:FKBP-type peptidyl-prolyl cis-trans isomerase